MARLGAEGVPTGGLDFEIAFPAGEPRPRADVARRLYGTLFVARAALEGRRPGGRFGRIHRDAVFTPAETAFLGAPTPERAAPFALRAEAALPLFWALGYVREMRWPTNRLRPNEFWNHLVGADFVSFVADSAPRPRAEILQQADLITRLYAASAAPGVDPAVIAERRLALDWLARPTEAWDQLAG